MSRLRTAWGIAGIFCMLLPVTGSGSETLKQQIVAGIVEPVAIGASGLVVDAKLDTGADICSLHARDVQLFDRDGGKWVRFDVVSRKESGPTLEAPVIRTVRIKGDPGSARRPVIRLRLCLGNVDREVDVNLADRKGYAYPLLVGRNFLAGHVVVDSGQKRMTRPDCTAATPK